MESFHLSTATGLYSIFKYYFLKLIILLLRRKTILLLLIPFVLSVIIRLPNLDRPLSKHHEFCTAFSLVIMKIAYEEKTSLTNFHPKLNFKNPNDKDIHNHSSKLKDKHGNYYYISHPPFGYIFPLAFFRIFSLKPGVLALQLFNIFFHLLTALLVYFTVCLLFEHKKKTVFRPAWVSYLFYLFLPVTLWFHGNVYMVDIFVQVFWVAGCFIFFKLIFQQKKFSFKNLSILGLISFIICYTEWIGYFFVISVLLYALYKLLKGEKKYNRLFFPMIAATLFALSLTVYNYSSINGFENYLAAARGRFLARSFFANSPTGNDNQFDFILDNIRKIGLNYITSYFPLLLGIFAAACIFIYKGMFKNWGFKWKTFVLIAGLPVILHHLIFMNYTGHDFAVLKSALLICVLAGPFYHKLQTVLSERNIRLMNFMVFGLLLASVSQYYYINRPGEVSLSGERYDLQKTMGEFMKANTTMDEVVFLKNIYAEPQLIFYAKRNIQTVGSREEALEWLTKRGKTRGVYFESGESGRIDFYKLEK